MGRWLLPITAILIGTALGLGAFTFVYAEGYSYLTNDPAACANCHVMEEQYAGWLKSSHRSVAGCNDCHTPHDPVGKYTTKALNGFWHSYYFTTGTFHDPIRITARNREITEEACRYCHERLTAAMLDADAIPEFDREDPRHPPATLACTSCLGSVGHWTRK
ncbi:MAG: cytochrome c nitrite reductase small subunit [Gemmatimonadota bacterium]|nr:cytochrome c nitrite reductase small subunit [Gemmatimonadota bacterium]